MEAIAIGKAVKRWRQARGLSQRALAERSGVGYVNIARLELGQVDPRLSTLEKLAEALEIRLVDLLTEPKAERPAKKRASGLPAGRGRR
jgi:transcriptional regulator with XRE-family HTH domain